LVTRTLTLLLRVETLGLVYALMDLTLMFCVQDLIPFGYLVVTAYNLPSEMCMTTPFTFMTCVILDPKNPKNRINVCL